MKAKKLLIAITLASACDGSGPCATGRDVSAWSIVEASPDAVTTKVMSCDRHVGWDITVKDGDHASIAWRAEHMLWGKDGDKFTLGFVLDTLGTPPADMLRPSFETFDRREVAFAEYRGAVSVKASLPPTTSTTPGVYQVLQIGFPVKGPYHARLSEFSW